MSPSRTLNYGPTTTSDSLPEIISDLLCRPVVKSNKKVEYFDVPCAFDIETTSATGPDGKVAFMYHWQLGLDGYVVFGRTWEDLEHTLTELSVGLGLFQDRRLIVYVHNLSFEFQFLAHRLKWKKVFALDQRKPVYALTESGIEFRCSYILSGYGLSELGKHLVKYPCEKMTGDLDYDLIRHSSTPMTAEELKYCENDVRVVMCYIQEQIEDLGSIIRIPLTKTGYVRRYCRKACYYGENTHKNGAKQYQQYRRLMNTLTLDPVEFRQLLRAFQGGFTHANACQVRRVHEGVTSYDFTSSYPTVMCSRQFPMSKAEFLPHLTKEEFKSSVKLYCCLFDIEIFDLEATTFIDHPLSFSRCFQIKDYVVDNGRVVSAGHLVTTMTEQDYFIFLQFYRCKSYKISNFRRYKKGYLPPNFVKAILKLYADKTTLKGVEGRELEYQRSKEMLNSAYGMCVTNPCRDEDVFNDGDWSSIPADVEKAIDTYNKSKNRFLFYPWGVWVTAYARRNLFTGIYSCGPDYIYSDTDSIKILHADAHKDYIDKYNDLIVKRLDRALSSMGIDPEASRPVTIDGKVKQLGVWDFDGHYDRFKTLGAKRYIYETDGELHITVAGLGKKIACKYLKSKYEDPFKAFEDCLHIPPEWTGKNLHTYIDYEQHGLICDYTGKYGEYHECSSTHLCKIDFTLSLSAAYLEYLDGKDVSYK